MSVRRVIEGRHTRRVTSLSSLSIPGKNEGTKISTGLKTQSIIKLLIAFPTSKKEPAVKIRNQTQKRAR